MNQDPISDFVPDEECCPSPEGFSSDGPCVKCGHVDPPWSVSNELWNMVTDRGAGVWCMGCFERAANTKGIKLAVWFNIFPCDANHRLLYTNALLKELREILDVLDKSKIPWKYCKLNQLRENAKKLIEEVEGKR